MMTQYIIAEVFDEATCSIYDGWEAKREGKGLESQYLLQGHAS
jgi:hypothetical protein